MITTFSFYHRETGTFHGGTFGSDDVSAANIARHTPAEHVAIVGKFDHLSQKVDISTGTVVDYQPPQPSADHEWNQTTRRWRVKPTVLAAQGKRTRAQRQIEEYEHSTLRLLRQLILDPTDTFAREQLAGIDAKIAALRPKLKLNS